MPILKYAHSLAVSFLLCTACQKDITDEFFVATYTSDNDSLSLGGPISLAFDADGSLYVTDNEHHYIRTFTHDGNTSIVAGKSIGYRNGIASYARFNAPRGMAVDRAGNLIIADKDNNRVRKMAPDGTVSTIAGNDEAGSADGTGKAASFNGPRGVAIDQAGIIYVADAGNNLIRKITPEREVSTIAGSKGGLIDGPGDSARFNEPVDLVIDQSQNIYVVDRINNSIRKITSEGVVSTLAGNGTTGSADGIGTEATFNEPSGITLDQKGNIYVADAGNNKIRKITPEGRVSTIAGNGTGGANDGMGDQAEFNSPRGIAFNVKENMLYVADRDNRRIRKIQLR